MDSGRGCPPPSVLLVHFVQIMRAAGGVGRSPAPPPAGDHRGKCSPCRASWLCLRVSSLLDGPDRLPGEDQGTSWTGLLDRLSSGPPGEADVAKFLRPSHKLVGAAVSVLSFGSQQHLSICPPVHLSTCPSVHLSISSFVTCPSVHLYFYHMSNHPSCLL